MFNFQHLHRLPKLLLSSAPLPVTLAVQRQLAALACGSTHQVARSPLVPQQVAKIPPENPSTWLGHSTRAPPCPASWSCHTAALTSLGEARSTANLNTRYFFVLEDENKRVRGHRTVSDYPCPWMPATPEGASTLLSFQRQRVRKGIKGKERIGESVGLPAFHSPYKTHIYNTAISHPSHWFFEKHKTLFSRIPLPYGLKVKNASTFFINDTVPLEIYKYFRRRYRLEGQATKQQICLQKKRFIIILISLILYSLQRKSERF